jgi:hypothetical protein
VLGVIHVGTLLDQKDGHAVDHLIALVESRVVEDLLVGEPQQGLLVDRAGQYIEQ